jgi:hypothetical protein
LSTIHIFTSFLDIRSYIIIHFFKTVVNRGRKRILPFIKIYADFGHFDLTQRKKRGIINCNKPKMKGFIRKQFVEKAPFFCGEERKFSKE